MNNPLVSIIIPTFNRSHLIGETLDSIIAQTYTNWECIVVDDGSTDNTDKLMAAYCEKDTRFQYHHRPKSRLKGGNAARNYGFELSQGVYIQWFDSDDLMSAKNIENQIKLLIESGKQVTVCISAFFQNKPKDINPLEKWEMDFDDKGVVFGILNQNCRIPVSSIIWNRNIVEKSVWNEGVQRGQEWLFHQITFNSLKEKDIVFLPEILSWIRKTKESKSLGDNKEMRYQEYLIARIALLRYYKDTPEKLDKYFKSIYNESIKYVRLLIKKNRYSVLFNYSRLICFFSVRSFIFFVLGCITYKIIGKDFFLKKVI